MGGSFDNRKLRAPFAGSESIERHYSQAGQDLFVASLLNGKRNGVFLDLGCNAPIEINNTYLLESEFDWNGLSVDIDNRHFPLYVFRRSKIFSADCTRLDWEEVIETLGTSSIDYLSLDLEPPEATLQCLRSIPFDRITFSAISFEHDAYRAGDTVRVPSREILADAGYTRICSDVRLNGLVFEDWYCDPVVVDGGRLETLKSRDEEWGEIIFV